MIRTTALSLAALAAAGPALAEVSASEVWADLQDSLDRYGYEVSTGDVADAGGTVTVTALTLRTVTEAETFNDEFEEVTQTTTTSITLPTLTIAEAGSEAEVTFPAAMPVEVVNEVEGADATTVAGTLSQEGMTVRVSEAEGGLAYDYAADTLRFVLDSVTGADAPEEAEAEITIADISGRNVAVTEGDVRTVSQTSETGAVAGELRIVDAEEGTVTLGMQLAGMTGTGRIVLPDGVTLEELGTPGASLPDGLVMDADVEFDAITLDMDVDSPEDPFTYANDSRGMALAFDVADGRIVYGITGEGGDVRISGAGMPIPEASFSTGGTEFRFDIPTQGGADAQPFDVLMSLQELTIDDALWSLFDAQGALDRSPASLRIDLDGTVVVPEGDEGEMAMAAFPEPKTLNLGGIELSLLGATLGATGSLDINGNMMTMMMGAPSATGTIEIDASGINGLMQDLVRAGLLPAEQAGFVAGMLGFMARPTGDDAFATEIVFGQDGSITANGMPLR